MWVGIWTEDIEAQGGVATPEQHHTFVMILAILSLSAAVTLALKTALFRSGFVTAIYFSELLKRSSIIRRALTASTKMHSIMLRRVLRAPVLFFDTSFVCVVALVCVYP